MFFKNRRSRANSYIENDPPARSQSYDDYDNRDSRASEPTSRNPPPVAAPDNDADMYPRQSAPQEPQYPNQNGGHHSMPAPGAAPLTAGKPEPMPDLLAQAFNQAVRPYTEKIEQLQAQLEDMQSWIDTLEQQRKEVHEWIDKRGLRPDVPPSIAKIMDSNTNDASGTLNAQLDRKITIVNFDLHRLQDDLNDSISAAHFASAMLKFLPDIHRLTLLPGGPRHAFDLVLKLGGNLNSHGGLDSGDAADIAARRDFYGRLDQAMVDVVSKRLYEGEDWNVLKEIRRIEKTGNYLKGFGVEPYFEATLQLLKREVDEQAANQNGRQQGGMPNGAGGMNGGGGSPPRYH